MTFDEWWNEWGVEMAHLPEKSAAKKAWEAATLAERDECSKVCDNMAVGEGDEDYAIGSAWCAAAIRARSNAALTGAAKVD